MRTARLTGNLFTALAALLAVSHLLTERSTDWGPTLLLYAMMGLAAYSIARTITITKETK